LARRFLRSPAIGKAGLNSDELLVWLLFTVAADRDRELNRTILLIYGRKKLEILLIIRIKCPAMKSDTGQLFRVSRINRTPKKER
jgi:hypothetical protein